MQGRTYCSAGVKDEMADAIREFNQYVRQDSRVDVLALPFRDGVSIITRRYKLLLGFLAQKYIFTLPLLASWYSHVYIGESLHYKVLTRQRSLSGKHAIFCTQMVLSPASCSEPQSVEPRATAVFAGHATLMSERPGRQTATSAQALC